MNSRREDGRQTYCKECAAAYHEQNRQQILERKHTYYQEHRVERLEKGRIYNCENREKVAAQLREYRCAHREEIAKYRYEYYRERREAWRESNHLWYIANKASVYQQTSKWAKAHPEVTNARLARHRARKLGAFGAQYTTADMIQARWDLYGGRCYLCGEEAQATDHVKPLVAGGAHLPCNLRPICNRCNSVKAGRWPYALLKGA